MMDYLALEGGFGEKEAEGSRVDCCDISASETAPMLLFVSASTYSCLVACELSILIMLEGENVFAMNDGRMRGDISQCNDICEIISDVIGTFCFDGSCPGWPRFGFVCKCDILRDVRIVEGSSFEERHFGACG
ncbi:hypothetical protein SARC_07933 [Sphaeroforma arctica JP610]|uniref:Uncharacterized protein n=1 Tax=Sphaeroforma arctica JP610 TaxID=667725 RepID=A0A0L0FSL3_9EUKA|nr:hypothetical protein SARC_07933 [Sphaeroforma arctica JP610]KNC79669.1 hypothetical protein SARC_07933 [Sphaeroforma arctica JP610]|eukprot:XP_014153571.1 hypothetical protein SARC_07933 [Sphaeroforma arctica JP610]